MGLNGIIKDWTLGLSGAMKALTESITYAINQHCGGWFGRSLNWQICSNYFSVCSLKAISKV